MRQPNIRTTVEWSLPHAGPCGALFDSGSMSGKITHIMRRIALFSLLLVLAVVVVGISFALMRNLKQPLLVYVILMPVWRVTFKSGRGPSVPGAKL